ncbi:MAG: hypothetical protein LBU90_07555 [Bacteroidales bacterium]|jgi:CRISPR/Cas system-associated endonuclease Cas3-HD|nr:hypothetical protein [Bacteroidales bacterium]
MATKQQLEALKKARAAKAKKAAKSRKTTVKKATSTKKKTLPQTLKKTVSKRELEKQWNILENLVFGRITCARQIDSNKRKRTKN